MKTLLLLRHADAPREVGETDRERKISFFGIDQAQRVGKYLKKMQIDLVKSSDSLRTRQTAKYLAAEFNQKLSIDFIEALYNSSPEVIIDEIAATDDSVQTLMVLAHNPGITQAGIMLKPEGSDELNGKMQNFEHAAKLVVLKVDIENWGDIYTSRSSIQDVLLP